MSPVVSNTSPLVVLAKAGLLELLPRVFSEVIIPNGVRDEILAGPDNDPIKNALPKSTWLRTQMLEPPLTALAGVQLGLGEAEAIELAQRRACAVLLDDRAARRMALALKLKVFGTLSVISIAFDQDSSTHSTQPSIQFAPPVFMFPTS